MSTLKQAQEANVFEAAEERIRYVFDNFPRIYVSFSGGKDSTVMLHMVMAEAIRRKRRIGVLIIDLEAQYKVTMEHVAEMLDLYREHAEVYWVCLPIVLRNAVSQFTPRWEPWSPDATEMWVRPFPEHPGVVTDPAFFPFFVRGMEFEEFDVLFGAWYSQGEDTAAFIGIRCDESLNRFRTIASKTKEMFNGQRFTTKIEEHLYNVYPLYDWRTRDIWIYHAKHREKPWNRLYDMMHLAGLTPHQMRICQPYGDDQRRGLWLYHLIEPESWFRVVARVNGANSGALYVTETGNVMGYNQITKPPGHTWQSFCKLLLSSLPKPTREHYLDRFRSFLKGWRGRGYGDGIPDEAPRVLEKKQWAPSWRRLCKVLLRNDWWCKGLGLTQPKSKAYEKYLELRRARLAALPSEEVSA
jgi:predicted phosphoadenosine phosphosulfate sulfurtransferase